MTGVDSQRLSFFFTFKEVFMLNPIPVQIKKPNSEEVIEGFAVSVRYVEAELPKQPGQQEPNKATVAIFLCWIDGHGWEEFTCNSIALVTDDLYEDDPEEEGEVDSDYVEPEKETVEKEEERVDPGETVG